MKSVKKVIDFTNETVNSTAKTASGAFKEANKATHQVVEKIGNKGDQIRSIEQKLIKETRSYIRDNPLTSVGMAVGVGFVLSKWLNLH